MLYGFLALDRTSLVVVEAVLRGSTDFIQFMNLILKNIREFIKAAIVA